MSQTSWISRFSNGDSDFVDSFLMSSTCFCFFFVCFFWRREKEKEKCVSE